MHNRIRILGLLLCLILSACFPVSPDDSLDQSYDVWLASQLLALDDLDSKQPDAEIIGVYYRKIGPSIQFRIDFLDLIPESMIDIQLFITPLLKNSGKSNDIHFPDEWEIMIRGRQLSSWDMINSDGGEVDGGIQNIAIDNDHDFIVITLDPNWISSRSDRYLIKTTTRASDTLALLDETSWLDIYGIPEQRQARVVLVFKDTLKANTPRQLIRQWDGAHAGPYGRRHGLRYLLSAASTREIPIVLVDLKTPLNLFGLELLGQLEWLFNLQESGLVILPDAAYGDPEAAEISLRYSRAIGVEYGIKRNSNAYIQNLLILPEGYLHYFVTGSRAYSKSEIILNITDDNSEKMIVDDGLSFDVKLHLIRSALDSANHNYTIMGGSVRDTGWADATISSAVFAYIESHPWVHVLDANDLELLKASQYRYFLEGEHPLSAGEEGQLLCNNASYWKDLLALQTNPARHLIWSNYLGATSNFKDRLDQTCTKLKESKGYWLEIADWALSPGVQSTCDKDLDADLFPECILSSDKAILLINPDTAAIEYSVGMEQLMGKNPLQGSNPLKIRLYQHPFQTTKSLLGDDNSGITGMATETNGNKDKSIKISENSIWFKQAAGRCTIGYQLWDDSVKLLLTNCPKMDLIVENMPVIGYTGELTGLGITKLDQDDSAVDKEFNPKISISGTEWTDVTAEDILALIREQEDPDKDYPPLFNFPFGTTIYQLEESSQVVITYSLSSSS